jgi:hypothetical protein
MCRLFETIYDSDGYSVPRRSNCGTKHDPHPVCRLVLVFPPKRLASVQYSNFASTFTTTVKEQDENYKICQEVERYQHLLYMYKNEFLRTNKEEDLTQPDFDFMEHVLNLKKKLGSLQVEYDILSKANQAICEHTAQLEKLKNSLQNDNKTFSELVCLYSEESKPFRGLGDVYDDIKTNKKATAKYTQKRTLCVY